MAQETLYDILGIPGNSLPDEINNAYRRQAMKWHPDHHSVREQQAEEMFKRIAGAFKVLSNPATRADYNRSLNEAARRYWLTTKPPSAPRFGPPDISLEEAKNLFSGQLLYLASELAKRGYDKKTLKRALTALGCPAGLALDAVSAALKQASINCNAPSSRQSAHAKTSFPKRGEDEAPAQMSFTFATSDNYEPARLPEIRRSLYARW